MANPEDMTLKQQQRLALANQRKAARETANYADATAAKTLGLAQAFARGGLTIDTSAAPGFQSPVMGQFTGGVMRAQSRLGQGLVDAAYRERLLKRQPWYQKLLGDIDKNNVIGYTASGTSPVTSAALGAQPIL